MKTIFSMLGLLVLAFSPATLHARNSEPKTDSMQNTEMKTDKKVLVVFFSRTGENYAVGDITKGNTHIVAEMIAEATSGRLFEIVPEKAYPETYQECVEIAKQEKERSARPAIKGDIAVEDYDVVFIGYPNWWGDMPMAVYTFLEKHDWQGKTILPFCTHEGSGLSGTEHRITDACKGATVGKGLAVRGATAQNKRDEAKKAVQAWIEKADF
ncbi:MAG: flavodoxin [Alistipes sp.]|nr:flavodoxin [Alistipes senegalensis]MCM1249708.1 flavodoxin [Alistipes sp.]